MKLELTFENFSCVYDSQKSQLTTTFTIYHKHRARIAAMLIMLKSQLATTFKLYNDYITMYNKHKARIDVVPVPIKKTACYSIQHVQ